MTVNILLLEINAAFIIIGTPPSAGLSTAYSFTFGTRGGIGSVTLTETGSLPSGLSFSAGTISGTPTVPGDFPFTITARDDEDQAVTDSYILHVIALPLTLSGDLPNQATGAAITAYSYTASGGYGGNTFAIASGSLPTGLSLNTSTGQITGTPSAAGSFSWTVTVTDSHGTVSSPLSDSCTVTATTLTGDYPNQAAGTAPAAFSYSSTGGIGTKTFAVASGALPTGVSLNTGTGALTGTPSAAASYSWTISVTYSTSGAATISDSCTVSAPLALSGVFINIWDNGDAGSTAGSITITGGVSPYSIHGGAVNSGALPTGLSLSLSGGTLSLTGTTTAYGTYTFTVRIDDSGGGNITTASQTIIVGDPYWSSTSLLVHADGTNGSTSFPDSTGKHSLSPISASVTTTSPLMGTGSASFGGSGRIDNATIDTSLQFGAGNFTIEFICKSAVATTGANHGIYSADDLSGTRGWLVYCGTSGKVTGEFHSSSAGFTVSDPTVLTSGTIVKYAIVRDGGTLRIYANGVQVASSSSIGSATLQNSTTVFYIGSLNVGGSASGGWNGTLDELRVTKGVCRYPGGTSYTAQTRAFQNGGV